MKPIRIISDAVRDAEIEAQRLAFYLDRLVGRFEDGDLDGVSDKSLAEAREQIKKFT